MEEIRIREEDEYIKLGQLLKKAGMVSSGVEAKMFIQDGEVLVNGEVDTRRGRKLYDGDEVTLMTLHSAKGLEFKVVFIVGMEEGIFPHSRSFESESELEEERRLCYVGLTRAKTKLYLLSARQRTIFGSTSLTVESRFIKEIDESLMNKTNLSMVKKDEKESVELTCRVLRHTRYGRVQQRSCSGRSGGRRGRNDHRLDDHCRSIRFEGGRQRGSRNDTRR